MTDLAIDTINREIVLEAGDFVLSQDSSVQNGQILLWSKSAFCLNPTLGVGIGGLIGSDVSELNIRCVHRIIILMFRSLQEVNNGTFDGLWCEW